jgi:MFS family permease
MSSFEDTFGPLSATLHGLIVSMILIPAALASFFAGHLADTVDRPRACTIGALLFGLGAGIEAGSVNVGMLIAGRIITGIGEGLFLSTVVV